MEGVYVKTEPEPIPHASTSEPPVPLAVPLEAQPCRLCANIPERAIEIYSTEGLSNQLSDRINEYLPVKVSPDDKLPLCCCWTCVTTLLSFHELVVACVESEKRLQVVLTEPKPIPIPVPIPAVPDPEPEIPEYNDDDAEMMDADDGEGDDDYEPENDDEDEESEEETKPIPGTSDDTECFEIGETVITKQEHADETKVDQNETPNIKPKGVAFRQKIAEIKQRCQEVCKDGEIQYRCDICHAVDDQFFIFIEHYLDHHVKSKRRKASGKQILGDTEKGSPESQAKTKLKKTALKNNKQSFEEKPSYDFHRRRTNETKKLTKLCKIIVNGGNTQFRCFICERIFFRLSFLRSHLYRHSDGKEALEDNGETYKKRNEAIRKRCTFVDDSGQTYFKCTVCEIQLEEIHVVPHHHYHFELGQVDKTGVNMTQVKETAMYRLMVDEVKTRCKSDGGVDYYTCEFCFESLPTVNDVIEHYRKHMPRAPFSCTKCDFKFMFKCELECHQTRMHEVEFKTPPSAAGVAVKDMSNDHAVAGTNFIEFNAPQVVQVVEDDDVIIID